MKQILTSALRLAVVCGALALAACGRGDKAAASVQPTADTAKKAEDITLCPTYDNGKGGYFSVTLPASWGDHYLTECGANDGGYYVGFYEKTDHDNGLGGFLFMLEVFPTDYDYTELPEYQAICGLTVDGANYNLIAELPTDVQFANENADLYCYDREQRALELVLSPDRSWYSSVGSDCRLGGGKSMVAEEDGVTYITTERNWSKINHTDYNGHVTSLDRPTEGSVDCMDKRQRRLVVRRHAQGSAAGAVLPDRAGRGAADPL
mgnify:CR=1 FL=1